MLIWVFFRARYANVRYVWVTAVLTNFPTYAIVPTFFAWNVCTPTPNWRFKKEELTSNARSVQNLFIPTVSEFDFYFKIELEKETVENGGTDVLGDDNAEQGHDEDQGQEAEHDHHDLGRVVPLVVRLLGVLIVNHS